MSGKIYPVAPGWKRRAYIDNATYLELYARSIAEPEPFWAEQARRIDWIKPFTRVKNTSLGPDAVSVKWFEDGTTNAAQNCIDRHLPRLANHTAIIWEGDDPKDSKHITYQDLHDEVCRLGNVLKAHGVKKGDTVTIYLPMIPEAAYAMLACARIGAIHSVVFAGFSAESLAGRIEDCRSKLLITADEGRRGGRRTPLKAHADEAAAKTNGIVETMLVVRHTGGPVAWVDGRDVWYHEAAANVASECPCAETNAEDPLFILYTSGSTGAPKGVVHTTAGYLVFAAMTHKYVFDYREGDIFWCAADVGWVTGHSYIVYGPLANGATTVIFEGIPSYPSVARFWDVVDKHQVNIIYTAPTAIRALMRAGDAPVKATSRASLRLLGSVGEPINPEAWEWYYHVVGDARCPIVDTWWQTETGGIVISPLPGATDLKPGSVARPFFGIRPEVVDAEGTVLEGACTGNLVLADSWPGQMRTLYRDHERFVRTYFSIYPGKYFTGDGCRRDGDGYYWITGRVDDVLNVSGHRLGAAEVENSLAAHEKVAEAAVVGYPHAIKGQGIYAYVTLMTGVEQSEELRADLVAWVRKDIGAIASPDIVHFAPGLPKTRSGKIMRRILRKIAANEFDALGDTSTLADPAVVEDLIRNRKGCLGGVELMDSWHVQPHTTPMVALLFDTLRLSRRLRDEGHFTPEQAEALAQALGEATHEDLATKADFAVLESAFKAEIGIVKAEISFLKADIANLATKAELAELWAKLKTDIAELRTEFKTDIAELRTEFKTDIAELRTELKTDIAELRTELKTDIAELRAEIAGVKAELKADFAEVRAEIAGVKAELKADFAEVRAEIAGVKAELKADFAEVRAEIAGVKAELKADFAEVKADILKWMVGAIGFQTAATLGTVVALVKIFAK